MGLAQGEVIVYESEDGVAAVDVHLRGETVTVWLGQLQMQALFGRERSVVTKHINNIFKEGELIREQVCAKFAHTANDGKMYQLFNICCLS